MFGPLLADSEEEDLVLSKLFVGFEFVILLLGYKFEFERFESLNPKAG